MNKDESGIFVDTLTDYETVGVIGTEWHRCLDADGMLDNYITIRSEAGQRLILMQKESFQSRGLSGIRFKPILKSNIPKYVG